MVVTGESFYWRDPVTRQLAFCLKEPNESLLIYLRDTKKSNRIWLYSVSSVGSYLSGMEDYKFKSMRVAYDVDCRKRTLKNTLTHISTGDYIEEYETMKWMNIAIPTKEKTPVGNSYLDKAYELVCKK